MQEKTRRQKIKDKMYEAAKKGKFKLKISLYFRETLWLKDEGFNVTLCASTLRKHSSNMYIISWNNICIGNLMLNDCIMSENYVYPNIRTELFVLSHKNKRNKE